MERDDVISDKQQDAEDGNCQQRDREADQATKFAPDIIVAGDGGAEDKVERAIFFFARDGRGGGLGDDEQDDRELHKHRPEQKSPCAIGRQPARRGDEVQRRRASFPCWPLHKIQPPCAAESPARRRVAVQLHIQLRLPAVKGKRAFHGVVVEDAEPGAGEIKAILCNKFGRRFVGGEEGDEHNRADGARRP